MRQKSKILAIVLAITLLVVSQFAFVPSITYAEEAPTRIPENILNQAKQNRTPIIWFDFENVKPGDTTVTDKISGIVATYGEQKQENGTPTQYVTEIPVTDTLTLSGKAFQPIGNKDLLMPFEPLSQTGNEVTIQAWVRMAQIGDYHALFWATSVKGDPTNIQQKNFLGIFPKRGDTKSYALIVADSGNNGNEGATKVAAAQNVTPKIGEWALLTVSQNGTSAKIYINDQEVASGDIHYPMSQLYNKIKAADGNLTMDDVKMGIGAFTNGWGDDTLHGLVDDFKIYNVALTAEEIKAAYDSMKSKLDAMPILAFNVQQIGGPATHLPNLTRTAPASRDWGEFVWGAWHDNITGQLYLKTFVKVTKVPGKEDSNEPVGYLDYQVDGQGQKGKYAMPAVKDFEDGIWKSIVVAADVTVAGRKEFRFQNRNRDDIYNIFVGPAFVVDDDPTPLELPAALKAENDAYQATINAFPNYRPANFNEETGLVFKMDGLKHDNMSHNDRSYVTVTPNGNYLTSAKELNNHITWNGYPDRFGKGSGLPAGKYYIIYAYKGEGKYVAQNTDKGFGKWEWADKSGFFGNDATLDGKWHIQIDTVEFANAIPGNAEFRIRNEWHRGNFTLSVGQVFIMPYQDVPSISLEKTEFNVGEPIKVNFSHLDAQTLFNGKNVSGMKIVNMDNTDIQGAEYWINFPDESRNIYDPNGSYTFEFNADGSNMKFKMLAPGQYKMRLQEKETKAEIISITFTVKAPTIALNKTAYLPGESIEVDFRNIGDDISGMKIVKKDNSDIEGASYWIDLPDPGRNVQTPDGKFTYEFNQDGSNNKFKILPVGEYKMRLQRNDKSEAMSIEFSIIEDPAVVEVINAINGLPENISLDDEAAIVAARNKYNALSDSQKAMVGDSLLAKLVAAENKLAELKQGAEPTTPPPTSDLFPVSALFLLMTGAAGTIVFRKKQK